MIVRPHTLVIATLAWAGLVAAPARADGSSGATAAVADEAGTRFRRGVELYAEGDLPAALVEFTRAYQLVPRYKILYNLGQITYQQQDYVMAVQHFRRYLSEGGDEIPPPRRREVETEIRRLEQRTGKLDIQASEADARVLLDGIDVGATPLPAPLDANVGRRRVELVSVTGQRWSRVVDLAGGDAVTVSFSMAPPPRLSAVSQFRGPEDAPLPMPSWGADGTLATTPPPSRAPWRAWTATALLAVGAGVAGGLALNSARELEQARDRYPAAPDELQRLHDRTRTFSLIADGTLAATLIMAGVSTYLSLRGTRASR